MCPPTILDYDSYLSLAAERSVWCEYLSGQQSQTWFHSSASASISSERTAGLQSLEKVPPHARQMQPQAWI